MTDYPAWPFRPDWTSPIVETLEWLTAVQTSRSGAEQRERLRITPRRRIDYPVQLYGQERTMFDVWMIRYGSTPVMVPIPHEMIYVGGAKAIGTTLLSFDATYTEFDVGQPAVVQGDTFRAEVVEVTSVSATGITVSALTKNYPNGLTVAPAMKGQITEDVSVNRSTGSVYYGTVRFQSLEPTPRTPAYDFPIMHGGYPVLTVEPNAVDDLEYIFKRNLSVIDNSMSIPSYVDKSGRATATQKHEFFVFGRKERSDFRDMLYRLCGQSRPIWVPTFNDDLSPGQGWPDPDGLLSTVPDRTTALQFNRDGTFTVVTAASSGGVVSAPLWSDSVSRTSFMTLKRLGADSVEINHYGDLNTVATISLVFQDAPDLRVAGSYFKNPFAVSDADASTQPTLDLVDPITVSGAAGGM